MNPLPPHAIFLLDLFGKASVEAYVVGGFVRNVCLGFNPTDVDMAVACTPTETQRILTDAGVDFFSPGQAFGTITARYQSENIEITSFRRDVETNGRHAVVHFGGTLQEDALRRDFSMNALYIDKNGHIHDPLGNGISDLKNRCIRFIGNPTQRIEEDFLRILRFARFSGLFAHSVDMECLKACQQNVTHIQKLSKERQRQELEKIFQIPAAVDICVKIGIFEVLSANSADSKTLKRFILICKKNNLPIHFVYCVAILWNTHDPHLFAFSKKEKHLLKKLTDMPICDTLELLKYHFEDDAPLVEAFIQAQGNIDSSERISHLKTMPIPLFPIKAADLINLDVCEGPQMGRILKACEAYWLFKKTYVNKEDCLEYAVLISELP